MDQQAILSAEILISHKQEHAYKGEKEFDNQMISLPQSIEEATNIFKIVEEINIRVQERTQQKGYQTQLVKNKHHEIKENTANQVQEQREEKKSSEQQKILIGKEPKTQKKQPQYNEETQQIVEKEHLKEKYQSLQKQNRVLEEMVNLLKLKNKQLEQRKSQEQKKISLKFQRSIQLIGQGQKTCEQKKQKRVHEANCLKSNVYSLTIGEIFEIEREKELRRLRQQNQEFRSTISKFEQENRAYEEFKKSSSKKSFRGKLMKISELKNLAQFKKQQEKQVFHAVPQSLAQQNIHNSECDNSHISFRVKGRSSKNKLKKSIQNLEKEPEKNEKKQENSDWCSELFIQKKQVPKCSQIPSHSNTDKEIIEISKGLFQFFGVQTDSKKMKVKKYKNCVLINSSNIEHILWYFDGRFYFGGWQKNDNGEGQKCGSGVEYIPDKYYYHGQFEGGKRNGHGTLQTLTEQKKVIYCGQWLNGMKSGHGKQIDENNVRYEGEWRKGKKEGHGRLGIRGGDMYEGEFSNGHKNGQGVEHFKNGDKYMGAYLNSKFHGKGIYFWQNGSKYEGDFLNGVREGKGKWESGPEQNCDTYEGYYEDDKKHGLGLYRWANGSSYEGQFKNDIKDGEGLVHYPNGRSVKFLWQNGQPTKKLSIPQEKSFPSSTNEKVWKQDNESKPLTNIFSV